VLESQVRIASAMLGLDTSVSYLHAMKHGRSSLIYDLMEPLRPAVDRRLIEFVRATTFAKDDFLISIHGICKLNPELARRITSIVLADPAVLDSLVRFRDQILTGATNQKGGMLV
jgi:CRISPR-associated protein Cas1